MAKKCFILISLFIVKDTTAITFLSYPSSLAKGYDPLYSSSPLASLDGFS